jgi:hypothetical protein
MTEISTLSEPLEPVFAKYAPRVLFAYVFGSAASLCSDLLGHPSDVEEFLRQIKRVCI